MLASRRNLKMARSAHAYVRGSTIQFYAWLEASDAKLPKGPPVWICGDCHIGNLGPVADAKGRVAVQIRDLDQTVVGNPAHDLIRLGLSLASAVRGSDLPGVTTAHMLEQLVAGYESALSGEFDDNKDKSHRPKVIQTLLQQSVRRRWHHLAQERLEDVKPAIPLGRRFWPLSGQEREAIKRMFAGDEVRALLTSLQSRMDDDPIELLDAAYWVKGCSSLGRLRFAALVRVGKGKSAVICLVDIKEGTPAAAPRDAKEKMPKDNALRVVSGAKALSPYLGNRMMATRLLDRSVVLRELMPQDLKLEIERFSRDEAMQVARYLANVVGRAHARQMNIATRKTWLDELSKRRLSELDAPSWLWSSVVDLVAMHESAYLDHCRRHVLTAATVSSRKRKKAKASVA